MIEYVNRDAIKTRLESWQKIIKDKYGVEDDYVRCLDNAIFIVEDVPVADIVERKHGKWIEYPECLQYDNAYSDDHIVCSECCHVWSLLDNCTETFNYCPNCGARMDG